MQDMDLQNVESDGLEHILLSQLSQQQQHYNITFTI